MAENYDEDAEDSEYGVVRHYGPRFPTPILNGNYTKLVVAWASLVTIIVVSIFAYLWTARDQSESAQNSTLESMREKAARQDERMDWMQKEIERLQRP